MNQSLRDLIDACILALRTHNLSVNDLEAAMHLAYQHGKTDGQLELTGKMMAADARQSELRG